MLIILEGVDGAGKTTFAKELLHEMHGEATIRHLGPPEGDPLVECLQALRGYRPRRQKHLIIDRLHLGELIYGPIYRGESKLDGNTGVIEQRINTLGGLLVHMDVPLDVIEERVGVRGDDYVKMKDLAQIHRRYLEVVGAITDVPTITIDSRNVGALPQVLHYARLLEDAA